MKNRILVFAAGAGLLLGGLGLGQYISTNDQNDVAKSALSDLPGVAYRLSNVSIAALKSRGSSPAQVTQLAGEVNTQLQLIQIRQNAEIIRLLTVMANRR